jgi:hypothetical protein
MHECTRYFDEVILFENSQVTYLTEYISYAVSNLSLFAIKEVRFVALLGILEYRPVAKW